MRSLKELDVLVPLGRVGWTAVIALPVLAVSLGVLVATCGALTARRPAARRHCLDVIDRLTVYATALTTGR